ncbi:MAG: DUF4179 domain-containing protein [Anaerolineae bacterium]|nr:DUF4179 domain-containing protein [Anaerolineae bacterium]
MTEHRFARLLRELAEQEVPNSLDLWPTIRAQVSPQVRQVHSRPITRLGWTILALGLFLMVGAAAYAIGPVISQVFQFARSWQHVEETHLTQKVHLSQTIGDWTVTLERIYADANQILVGYTVSGPPDQNPNLARVTLTDDQGTRFPEMGGAGIAGASEILGVQLSPGQGAYIAAFDASAIQGQPTTLNLHLKIDLVALMPVSGIQPMENMVELPPAATVTLAPAMQMREELLAGPFTFDFSVPFIPGRVALVHRSVKTGDVTIRLERVVVTPSETRAILCFNPPTGKSEHWVPVATLEAGSRRRADTGASAEVIVSGATHEEMGCYRYSFFVPLASWRGRWKLTVTELVGMDPARPGEEIRIQGPWVFRFRVP